jgi:phosphoglycerate-specific signal transduction histidine kinase
MKKLLLIAIVSLISNYAFTQISKTQIDAALQAKGLDPSANDAYVITSRIKLKRYRSESCIPASNIWMELRFLMPILPCTFDKNGKCV